jgi:hypothetical protein
VANVYSTKTFVFNRTSPYLPLLARFGDISEI